MSALINDLKANGTFDKTLVVMCGEFGRTVGPMTAAGGRDHWPQQFAFFAGGGVKGGTMIGQTDAQGRDTVDYGWSRESLRVPGGYRGDDLLGDSASTGPRCAATTRWDEVSSMCRRPALSRSCRFTNSGDSE